METTPFNRFSQAKPIFDYLKKQQENERFLKTLEITATFVLIIFFVTFAIRPTVLTISTLLGDIESKKILKTELNKKIGNIIEAQDYFAEVEGKYSIVNNSLPDHPNYYDAINQIKNSCQSGCNLNALNFNFEQDKTSVVNANAKTFTVSVSTNGSFTAAIDLASKVLQNQRLLNISSLEFGSEKVTSLSSSSSSSSRLGTSFNTVFYYWPASP